MAEMKECPFCAEEILAVAVKCKYCGEYLDDEQRDNTRKGRSAGTFERMLAPVETSGMAIIAGYMGLFSFFPLVGIVPAIIGIFTGRAALKEIERKPNLSGKGRAWFAILCGSIFLVLWSIMGIALIVGMMNKR